MTRRRILRLLLSLGAIAATAPALTLGRSAPTWPWRGQGHRSAAVIGRRLLALDAPEARRLRELATRLEGEGLSMTDLTRRVRSDFARERVVQVDGWILSRTEAAFCVHTACRGDRRERAGAVSFSL
jgi:hypothetical protein